MGDEPKTNPPTNPNPNLPPAANISELVPRRMRSWIYLGGAVVALLTWLTGEVTVIWAPEYAEQIMQTTNRILAAAAMLTGGTGAAYRPASL